MNAYRTVFFIALFAAGIGAANAQGTMSAPHDTMAAPHDTMAKSDTKGDKMAAHSMAMGKPMKHDSMKHDSMKHDAMKSDSMAAPAH